MQRSGPCQCLKLLLSSDLFSQHAASAEQCMERFCHSVIQLLSEEFLCFLLVVSATCTLCLISLFRCPFLFLSSCWFVWVNRPVKGKPLVLAVLCWLAWDESSSIKFLCKLRQYKDISQSTVSRQVYARRRHFSKAPVALQPACGHLATNFRCGAVIDRRGLHTRRR